MRKGIRLPGGNPVFHHRPYHFLLFDQALEVPDGGLPAQEGAREDQQHSNHLQATPLPRRGQDLSAVGSGPGQSGGGGDIGEEQEEGPGRRKTKKA